MATMRKLIVSSLFIALAPAAQAADTAKYQAPRNEYGQPDLRGVWNFSSDVPLQRPKDTPDKLFRTREDIAKANAAREKQFEQLTQQGVGFHAPTPQPPSGGGGKSVSQLADEVIAGHWGNGDDRRTRLQNAGYDYNAVQAEVNRKLGGGGSAPAPSKSIQQLAEEVLRGEWGNDPQRRALLLGAGHDANAVQAEVNRRLSGGAPSAGPRPGVREVAKSVIRGEWGNGADRVHRLTAAGYNAAEVQAEVNRQLGY